MTPTDKLLIQVPATTPPEESGRYFTSLGISFWSSTEKCWEDIRYSQIVFPMHYFRPAAPKELMEIMKEPMREVFEFGKESRAFYNYDFDDWFNEKIKGL